MLPFARVALAMLAAVAVPALAQESAADPEVGSFVCELSGDCAAPDAPAAEAAPAPRGARTSATRGFTFKRTAPAAGATAPAASATAMMATTTAAPVRSANLKLDFASGSATLMPAARARLAKLASALGTPRLAGHRMRIEGHTDASGSAATNKELSQRRAQAAADYLVSQGVAADRLDVIGYGSSRPLTGIAATSAENRRVMAVMVN